MSETRPLGIEEAALREAASKETSPSLESRRFVYSKETDPGRLQEIKEKIEQSRFLRFEFEGQEIQIEYIEVEAKKTQEVHEDGVRSPVDIIIPGFCASLIPFKPTVREMAEYMPDHRIICVSPLDSGKSSALKDSSLEKMNRVTTMAALELFDKRRKSSLGDIAFRPLAVFFKMFMAKCGFLDGFPGLLAASLSLMHVFIKYVKLRMLWRNKTA